MARDQILRPVASESLWIRPSGAPAQTKRRSLTGDEFVIRYEPAHEE